MSKRYVRNARNTRIPCICQVRTANIIKDGLVIGTISEEMNDAGETDWVITPNYANIDEDKPLTISGIDLSLHLKEYIRTYVPVFVEERTPSDSREDLRELLDAVGLDWNDRFEYMCRTHGVCGNNDITVERCEEA